MRSMFGHSEASQPVADTPHRFDREVFVVVWMAEAAMSKKDRWEGVPRCELPVPNLNPSASQAKCRALATILTSTEY
jgi:hypothetical protein